MSFLKLKSNIFRFFYYFYVSNDQPIFAFKNKSSRVYHECAFEFTDWLIWLIHKFWLVHLNKPQLVKILLTACNYYLLGMFKNVPHVQNKTRLHMKYLLNVNSLEIICSGFLLLILIKNAIKNAVTAAFSLYMVCLESPEIKILKSRQIQVKLVLQWNCSFEFAYY